MRVWPSGWKASVTLAAGLRGAVGCVWPLIVLPAWALAAAAYFPGVYTPDSFEQLAEAVTGTYTDWHPPMMAGWWAMLLRLTGSASSMFFFHQALLLCGLLATGTFLVRERARILTPLVALIPLLPVVVNFSGVVWKDVGFAFALLFAAGLAGIELRGPRMDLLRIGIVFTLCLYALGVRLNGLLSVGPILLLALLPRFGEQDNPSGRRSVLRAVVTAGVLTSVCALLVVFISYEVLHAKQMSQLQMVQLTDLAGIRNRTHEDAIPAFSRAVPGPKTRDLDEAYRLTMERGSAGYLFFVLDGMQPPLRTPANEMERRAVSSAWRGAIGRHPGAYLKHRMVMMSLLLRIGYPIGYYQYILPPTRAAVDALPQASTERGSEVARELLRRDLAMNLPGAARARSIATAIIDWSAARAFYLGWPWVLAGGVVFVASLLLLRRASRAASTAALVSLSGLAYCGLYFFVTPAADFRYLYWTVLSVLFASLALGAALVGAASRAHEIGVAENLPPPTPP